MRNRYLERLDEQVKIKIVGRNIHNFLKRMMKRKIQMIQVIPISYREVHVILKYSEYKKLIQYRSIYEISILEARGRLKLKENIRKNYILLFWLVMGCFLIFFLSHVIFDVEVIHQDKEIRKLLIEELSHYGIHPYTLKKSYDQLEQIEDQILEENKDKLEWIEIIEYGTKYTVRVEERKIHQESDEFQYQSIVSKKNAVLVEVDAIRGEKVKTVHDYVKKGDTVISGWITLPNNSRVKTMALGKVLGEVWYSVNIDYPFVYQETNFTGKSKTVYVLHFFNKRFSLFDFDEYKSFQTKDKVLFASNFLDLRFTREKQYEVVVKDEVYTEDIAKNKAIDYIKDKMMKDNPDIVEVLEVKILSSFSDEDSIQFKLFVRTKENIGVVAPIEEEIKEEPT